VILRGALFPAPCALSALPAFPIIPCFSLVVSRYVFLQGFSSFPSTFIFSGAACSPEINIHCYIEVNRLTVGVYHTFQQFIVSSIQRAVLLTVLLDGCAADVTRTPIGNNAERVMKIY
jgi:hypothetical protein